ncbi:MAG: hypothetical protein ACI9J3_000546 [Parvicellaceae bacterium]
MKFILIIFLVLFLGQLKAQQIAKYSDFRGFDTLDVLKEWQYSKEYYSKDTVKYDVRFKQWGKGCNAKSGDQAYTKKCKFYIQEQLWRKDGTLEWKHGLWGSVAGSFVEEKQVFFRYTKSGKLAQKSSKKNDYKLE